MQCGVLLFAVRCSYAILRAVLVWLLQFMWFGLVNTPTHRSNSQVFQESSKYS